MCVICIKKLGVSWPENNLLNNCMQTNPHGFSLAWNEGDTVKNFKTMSPQALIKKYNQIKQLDCKTTAMIFHARIATHGSHKLSNCHCWIEDNIAFAHNGILYDIPVNDDRTDSETFFSDYFMPVMRHSGIKAAGYLAKKIIGTSKFAFLGPKGAVTELGNWVQVKEKNNKGTEKKSGILLFSNNSFGRTELIVPSEGMLFNFPTRNYNYNRIK